jgi:hypothetical protein
MTLGVIFALYNTIVYYMTYKNDITPSAICDLQKLCVCHLGAVICKYYANAGVYLCANVS